MAILRCRQRAAWHTRCREVDQPRVRSTDNLSFCESSLLEEVVGEKNRSLEPVEHAIDLRKGIGQVGLRPRKENIEGRACRRNIVLLRSGISGSPLREGGTYEEHRSRQGGMGLLFLIRMRQSLEETMREDRASQSL